MLPIPFITYIPKLFKDDSKAIAFGTRMDVFLKTWKTDVLNMRRAYRFDEVKSYFLPELAFLLNVTLLNQDTDATQRKKIKNGILTHKYRGTWNLSVKPELDAITGYSAVLLTAQQRQGDWVLISPETSLSEMFVASLGTDGSQGLGLNLSGSGDEATVPGNIYINLHNGVTTAVLTASQLQAIKNAVQVDIIPAYFKIFFGYIDAGNLFVTYLSF